MNCFHPTKRAPNQRMCRKCHAEYMREWRKTEKGKMATQRHNERLRGSVMEYARSQVSVAIRKGSLLRPDSFKCKDCGAQAQVYDHRDYSKPLIVDPVCRSCNALRGPENVCWL